MRVIPDPGEFQAACAEGAANRTLGLVPTMGALHEGHLSLVRRSKAENRRTATSIFVNPTQFGPQEDFDRYPRPLEHDLELLRSAGVDLVFTPGAMSLYPEGEATRVEVQGLGERLDGASRPGHFRGVATIVLKLLQVASPTRAYFGQKDAAQVAVIRRMARDLFLPVQILVCPIVREPDGLAMSSRNAYLGTDDRRRALAISRSLQRIQASYASGERSVDRLLAEARGELETSGLRLDYLAAVDADTLLPVPSAAPNTLFAVAAFAGTTRLIDNWAVPATAKSG